jgi:N-acetylmuramic acid 6-phosphate etherase
MSALATVAIELLTGPEVVTGSTRMKAGTGQKLVLNILSTATMVRLGKVYGNLMVDVRPTNEKLRRRAVRIVAEAVGLDDERALALLQASQWEVKIAVVMGLLNVSAAEAARRLAVHHGHLRRTVAAVG